MAVTLLRIIAHRCIVGNGITIEDFHPSSDMPSYGYCSERLVDILRKEAKTQRPKAMRICILQVVEDVELEAVRQHLVPEYIKRYGRNIIDDLRYRYMVALAREIKLELIERRGETNNARN